MAWSLKRHGLWWIVVAFSDILLPSPGFSRGVARAPYGNRIPSSNFATSAKYRCTISRWAGLV